MATRIEIRRDTSANWATANPVLNSGEPGYELDTGLLRVGDGVTSFTSLPSSIASGVGLAMDATLAVDATKGANALALGGVNDTAKLSALSVQAASAGLPLRLPPGRVYIGKWVPTSGVTYLGASDGSTILTMHSSFQGTSDRVIDCNGISDVAFMNLAVDGNKAAYTGTATEQRHVFNANNVTRLSFFNVRLLSGSGDGLYVGVTGGHSSTVTAYRLRCDGNWRNGMSIVDLDGGTFVSCAFVNASGTAPQAGVDIEPNDNTQIVRNVRFIGCTMSGNVSYGVANTFYPGGTQGGVKFTGCTIINNGTGVYLYNTSDFEFANCDVTDNTLDGVWFCAGQYRDVRFLGGSVQRNGHHGINCQPTTAKISGVAATATIAPTLVGCKIIGTTFLDNGSATANTYYGMLWDVTGSTAQVIDGLVISGVTSANRATTNQKYGVYFSQSVKNLVIDNSDFHGNATSAVIYNDDAATRRRGQNIIGTTLVAGAAAATTMSAAVTRLALQPAAAFTVTLPPVPEPEIDYTLYDANGNVGTFNVTVQVYPGVGHAFADTGATSTVMATANGHLRMFFHGAKWFVVTR